MLTASNGDRSTRLSAADRRHSPNASAGASRWSSSAACSALAGLWSLVLMRDRPSDLDLPAYGETKVDAAASRRSPA